MSSLPQIFSPEVMAEISKMVMAPQGPNPFVQGLADAKPAPSPVEAPGHLAEMPMAPIGMEARGHTSYMAAPPRPVPGSVDIGPDFQPAPSVPQEPLKAPGSAPIKMPQGPGTKMFNILTLQQMMGNPTSPKSEANPALQNVYTRQPEALKVAIQTLGIAGPNNPNGIAVDMDTAKEIWFGSKDAKVSAADEAAFRAIAQSGDQKIDRKRIKQYVNYDGSTTWEILNNDKSIMSRFTLGSSEGKKVFAQGGYNEYAAELGTILTKMGQDSKIAGQFEATRKKVMGV